MSETQTPTPPPGTRYKGTARMVWGWILIVFSVIGLIGSVLDLDGEGALGAGAAILVGAGLVRWGKSLRAKRILMPVRQSRARTSRRSSDVVALDVGPHLQGAAYAEHGRVSLYVMDKHRPAIHKLVRAHGDFVPQGRSGSGAFATWGAVVAEPSNRYDHEVVSVEVDGQQVGYFALEWKDVAHEALRKARGKQVLAPVVVRWRAGRGEHVWVHQSMDEAASFAGWLTRQDHEGVR